MYIEWQHYRWPWRSLLPFETFLVSHSSWNITCIIYDIFPHDQKVRVACDFNCLFRKRRTSEGQESHVHGKSGNTCISETVQDRRSYYRPLIGSHIRSSNRDHSYDLQCHLHIARLFKCDFWYSCTAVKKISTDSQRFPSAIAEFLVTNNYN